MQIADKVRQALERYAEGGSLAEHLDDLNMKRGAFYEYLRRNHDVKAAYHEIQEARADMMVDETYALDCADPKAARVKAEIRLKIAALYDRRRFGERVQLDVQHVDLTGALQDAQTRALRPMRDLGMVGDAQVIDESRTLRALRTDNKPALPAETDAGDIFGD
jgi:hypothetical protein